MTEAKHLARIVIDTHCHVHVEDLQGKEKGKPCCGDSTEHVTTNTSNSSSLEDKFCSLSGKRSIQDTTASKLPASTSFFEVFHIPMGIKQDDWIQAVQFGSRSSTKAGEGAALRAGECSSYNATSMHFRFGIGLHPWHAHSKTEAWLQDLTALLEAHPRALVGEIGLDKVARTQDTRRVEWDDQLEVFNTQMALAARLCRPVSVHCVKAHGKLVDVLRGGKANGNSKKPHRLARAEAEGEEHGRLPPRIALHSFTGSVEMAKDLCRLSDDHGELFFGFSAAVNMSDQRRKQYLFDVVRAIPGSSILIETDRMSLAGTGAELVQVCKAIAEAKGVTLEEATLLANRNAGRFLSPITSWSTGQSAV